MKVSIITTVYNREKTIRDTIESVLAQTYPNIEYIIVDGASKDNSLKVIREYEDRIAKIISEPDRGMYEAINKGIRAATGDIIGLMHSDDVFYSNDVIRHYVERFKMSNADLVYANGLFVDEEDTDKIFRVWTSGKYSKRRVKCGWLPLHPTVYIKRDVILANGLYDESYMIASDSDFLVRYLYDCNLKVDYLNETIVRMRVGGLSTSAKWLSKKWSEDLRMYESHNFNPYISLVGKVSSKIPQLVKAKFSRKSSMESVKNATMYNMDTLFSLLRVACGQYDRLPAPLTKEQWEDLYVEAGKQSVVGICFAGIEKLPENQKPHTDLYLDWFTLCHVIEENNNVLRTRSKQLIAKLTEQGIRSCQLKGTSIAEYYPSPELRQSGDIDLWCSPLKSIPEFMKDAGIFTAHDKWVSYTRKELVRFIEKRSSHGEVHYHHTDMNVWKNTCVEIHFTPSYMMNPSKNAIMQRWFMEKSDLMLGEPDAFDKEVIKFNVIYLLAHFYKHVLTEGIGIRHALDYLYVMKAFYEAYDNDAERQIARKEVRATIKELGMMRILGGLTWLLIEKVGMPSEWAICPVHDKEGIRLLRDMVTGGNFGHYNPRVKEIAKQDVGHMRKFVYSVRTNPNYMRFPVEALMGPFWSIKLFFLIRQYKR